MPGQKARRARKVRQSHGEEDASRIISIGRAQQRRQSWTRSGSGAGSGPRSVLEAVRGRCWKRSESGSAVKAVRVWCRSGSCPSPVRSGLHGPVRGDLAGCERALTLPRGPAARRHARPSRLPDGGWRMGSRCRRSGRGVRYRAAPSESASAGVHVPPPAHFHAWAKGIAHARCPDAMALQSGSPCCKGRSGRTTRVCPDAIWGPWPLGRRRKAPVAGRRLDSAPSHSGFRMHSFRLGLRAGSVETGRREGERNRDGF